MIFQNISEQIAICFDRCGFEQQSLITLIDDDRPRNVIGCMSVSKVSEFVVVKILSVVRIADVNVVLVEDLKIYTKKQLI